MNIISILSKKIKRSLIKCGASKNCDPLLIRSKQISRIDYQINGIMKIAKNLNINPMNLAKKVVLHINLEKECQIIEISKPGFINLTLKKNWIEEKMEEIQFCTRFKIKRSNNPKKIIIDYSSPNIAKEMHVGHLRSTVIGDSIVRMYEFLGHKVIRANHIGDWGTQFGMLITYLQMKEKKIKRIKLKEMEKFYKIAKKKYLSDKNFSILSRKNILKLQKKDKEIYSIWKKIVNITNVTNEKIYKKMRITLRKQNIMAESSYKKMLPKIVKDLIKKKIAKKKNNTVIIFLKEFKNKLAEPMGVIIQKSDGAFLYSTIDIACIKYRTKILKAKKIIYFTDSRQKQHLEQVQLIAEKANYISKEIIIKHYMFGMVLTKNNTPYKTRSGNTIKLIDLVNEAIKRAKFLISKKNPKLSDYELNLISEKIGIGAIKYFDLSKNRSTNYVFDWNTMLSLKGNTSLYIQYTYVRILSLIKKSKIELQNLKMNKYFFLRKKIEIQLSLKILQFEETLKKSTINGYPHIICLYLYELSVIYSNFYENYNILLEKNNKIKISRLKISFLTSKILKKGLYLLGISTVNYI
ncbi:Arginine--tRNA ligase [Buchnera aphidicola (Tetraneura ulmi)]|uniref:arginine--tRNA ligase n=1 Tax=Buchnera aphidicola TaxID=9 RepID=UPI0034643DEB